MDVQISDNSKDDEATALNRVPDLLPDPDAVSISRPVSLLSPLLLDQDGLDVLSRLTGVLSLVTCWEIFKRLKFLNEEYQVETWWWKQDCLSLPDSPVLVVCLLCICALSALAMLFGNRGKLAPLLVAASILYITSLDIQIAFSHSLFLNIWICIALLFRREGRSSSRRLIQLSLFACYGLSALQKALTPQFISGQTLEALQFGKNVQPWTLQFLSKMPAGADFWKYSATAVVATELLLALGLCNKQTRKLAVAGIIIFQLMIFATMDPFILSLHLTIFVCCLSFFDPDSFAKRFRWLENILAKSSRSSAGAMDNPGVLYRVLTVFAAAFLIGIPLRIYFYPHSFERMSLMDRRPWTFCMFVSMEGGYETSIVLKRRDGNFVWVKPRGRMAWLSSDTDMYALARYLEKTTPGIVELKIESQYYVNLHRRDHKVLTAQVDADGNFAHHIAWHGEAIKN